MHGGGPALSRTLLEPLASRKAKEAHRGELEAPQGGPQPPHSPTLSPSLLGRCCPLLVLRAPAGPGRGRRS